MLLRAESSGKEKPGMEGRTMVEDGVTCPLKIDSRGGNTFQWRDPLEFESPLRHHIVRWDTDRQFPKRLHSRSRCLQVLIVGSKLQEGFYTKIWVDRSRGACHFGKSRYSSGQESLRFPAESDLIKKGLRADERGTHVDN